MPGVRSSFIFLCDFGMNAVFSHNAFLAFMVYQFIQEVVQFLRHFAATVYMPVFLMNPADFGVFIPEMTAPDKWQLRMFCVSGLPRI